MALSAEIASLETLLEATEPKDLSLRADEILQRGRTMLMYAQRLNDDIWIARSHAAIGWGEGKAAHYQEAVEHYTKAIDIYTSLRCMPRLIRARVNREMYLCWLGELTAAYRSALQTIEMAREEDDPILYLRSTATLRNSALWLGVDIGVVGIATEALAIARRLKEPYFIQQNLLALHNIATAVNNREESLRYAEEAIKELDGTEQKGWVSRLYSALCHGHHALGHFEEAIPFGETALRLAQEDDFLDGISVASKELSICYLSTDRLAEAISTALIALHAAEESKNSRYISDAKLTAGRGHVAKGEYNEATSCFTEAIAIAEQLGSSELLCHAHLEYSKMLEHTGEYKQALAQRILHQKHREMHAENESKRRIEALEIQSGVEKERQEMKAARESLHKELAATTTQLISQTELISNFREDLRKILRKIEVKDPAINELRAKLKELPEGVDWRAFDEQFQQVHPQFRAQLEEKFPDLTSQESRICVLLRLNLNSRDI